MAGKGKKGRTAIMTTSLLARQRAHQRATPTALAALAGVTALEARARRLAPGSGAFNAVAAEALAAAREE